MDQVCFKSQSKVVASTRCSGCEKFIENVLDDTQHTTFSHETTFLLIQHMRLQTCINLEYKL
jgi:hypothetical protein